MDNIITAFGITYLLGILIWLLRICYNEHRKRKRRMFYLYWYEEKPIANGGYIDHGEKLIECNSKDEACDIFLYENPNAKISGIIELS